MAVALVALLAAPAAGNQRSSGQMRPCNYLYVTLADAVWNQGYRMKVRCMCCLRVAIAGHHRCLPPCAGTRVPQWPCKPGPPTCPPPPPASMPAGDWLQ